MGWRSSSWPASKTGDAELVAVAVAEDAMEVRFHGQLLTWWAKVVTGWFLHLPSRSQYQLPTVCRRSHTLTPIKPLLGSGGPVAPLPLGG